MDFGFLPKSIVYIIAGRYWSRTYSPYPKTLARVDFELI
ncbi:hypothetical protein DSOL_0790 [Desulfosporosinus metallidurans]|uniref:Uncharacterized protein n=1 Tax=Desulfosporosinus metallidurans TaxID=1888891 RepID=A0A1Q8R1L6_9FIRM|nr:hypothetical protein DSOL_0790 [Desulfosporosinus metallidurans]